MPDKKLTDSEIVKASRLENTEVKKIKAIYPHIEASIVYEKPYYMICWYDIEKKTMDYGYGSFNFEYVSEWLKEYFEVVENDFADLINRLQAENKELKKELAKPILATKDLKISYEKIVRVGWDKAITQAVKSEAYKEFAERVKMEFYYEFDELIPSIMADKIDNLLNELVGEDNAKEKE